MRRKAPTLPNNNGASSGYDQYGASSGGAGAGAGYSQGGQGYGTSSQQGGPPGGGYSYGNTNTNQNTGGGGGSSSGGGSSYSGYGNSSGGGGFGVGMGEAYGGEYGTSSKGKKKKTANHISFRFLMDKFIITVLLALLFLGATIFYRSQYKIILEKFHVQSIMDAVKSYDKLEVEKKRYQKESLSYKESDRQLKNSMRDLEKTNRDLKKQQEELKLKFDVGGMGLEESEKLKAREEAWKKQVQLLQNATQRESKRAVMERYVIYIYIYISSCIFVVCTRTPHILTPPILALAQVLITYYSRSQFPTHKTSHKWARSKSNSHLWMKCPTPITSFFSKSITNCGIAPGSISMVLTYFKLVLKTGKKTRQDSP